MVEPENNTVQNFMNTSMYLPLSVMLVLFIVSFSSYGEYIKEQPISIAFTYSMPPYLSKDMNSGIERDIIYEAFKAEGMTLGKIHNVHYKRAINMLEQGLIEGIVSNMTNYAYDQRDVEFYPSNKTIDYVDCAITLAEQNFILASIKDYEDKTIWGFKTAKNTLGPEFELMANHNPNYTEDSDQEMQAEMLVLKRIDIAISDRNIFSSKLIRGGKHLVNIFKFQKIGEPTPRTLRLSSQNHLERFNQGLDKIKQNGTFEKILLEYENNYAATCD